MTGTDTNVNQELRYCDYYSFMSFADFLARVTFEEALLLTDNDTERSYLRTRLSELTG
jgi:hypothetical protein